MASTPADWTPTLGEVAQKVRSRLRDANGNEPSPPVFTSETVPTLAEATTLRDQEVGALAAFIGPDLPPVDWALAKVVVLLRIASRIEMDFFAEQITTGRSPYTELATILETEMGRLVSSVRSHRAALIGGTGSGVQSIATRGQATIDSEKLPLPSDDVPPYLPTGWPLADPTTGAAGTIV